MGAKEDLLRDLCRHDATGGIQRLHYALVGSGLKFEGPSNSQTLTYYYTSNRIKVRVAALRGAPAILSFPATFWIHRRRSLNAALARAPLSQEPINGFVSSSQYSAGQLRIDTTNIEVLLEIVNDIIVPETRVDINRPNL